MVVNTFIVFISFQTLITLVCSKDLRLENKLWIEMKLKYKRTIYREYYMVARRYEISLRVLKYFFDTRREILYLQAAM